MFNMTLKTLFFIIVTFFSLPSIAYENSISLFASTESNSTDIIDSIGVGVITRYGSGPLATQLTMSISSAEVLTTGGYFIDYTAWEASAKFGIFSEFFVYGEIGIDLGELFFDDLRYENNNTTYNKIDTYIGIGGGFNLESIRVDFFSRIRNIDGEYWQAQNDTFGGVQVSINF